MSANQSAGTKSCLKMAEASRDFSRALFHIKSRSWAQALRGRSKHGSAAFPRANDVAARLVAALVCSAAFVFQMASVVTAQVVKAGEIVALMLPPGYVAGCVFSSLAVGGFTFCAPSRTVERANTVLTVALLVGFGGICCCLVLFMSC